MRQLRRPRASVHDGRPNGAGPGRLVGHHGGPAPDPVHERRWGRSLSSRLRASPGSSVLFLGRGDSCDRLLLRPTRTRRARPAGPEQPPAHGRVLRPNPDDVHGQLDDLKGDRRSWLKKAEQALGVYCIIDSAERPGVGSGGTDHPGTLTPRTSLSAGVDRTTGASANHVGGVWSAAPPDMIGGAVAARCGPPLRGCRGPLPPAGAVAAFGRLEGG